MSRTSLAAQMLGLVLCVASPALAAPALELAFPGPTETTASRAQPMTTFRLPIGPFSQGSLPTRLTEGAMDQTAFRVTLAQPSTLELIKPLRDQITAAGFNVLYECETDACGGYDFRYGTDMLPEPDMHIDLGDFRYLAATRVADGSEEFVALLVSRSAQDGFVQLTRIGQSGVSMPVLTTSTKTPDQPLKMTPGIQTKAFGLPGPKLGRSVPELADLGKRLELGQAQVLEDLVFDSGSSALADGDYASLSALANWLNAKPARKVTLVGHTDASGGLAGNINLSRLRAESVRQKLLFAFKVDPAQIVAEGVGYLAPRDSNQTEAGRQNNRRVEVMATSTELLAP